MYNINGKVLLFTDLHLGLKNGSVKRLEIAEKSVDEIIQYLQENNITECIFLGDWHHCRNYTDNNVLNVSYSLMSRLSDVAKVHMIIGNHDLYMKNTSDIHSLVMFKNLNNVNVISQLKEISINGNRSLLVPWLQDATKYGTQQFDMLFGHFDVSNEFITKSYIRGNTTSIAATDEIKDILSKDQMLASNSDEVYDSVGDFVEAVKENGTIFSGHIHSRKEFISRKRNFVFVGDPYQLNLGEKDNHCGFYVINEDNSFDFHEITSVPKHVEIRMSSVTDDFDFSIVKGNIIHKIYDIEVPLDFDVKVEKNITDWSPFEELIPDYEVDISDLKDSMSNESLLMIKKSKLEYIKSYISNIDEKALEENGVQRDRLYRTLESYYNQIMDKRS